MVLGFKKRLKNSDLLGFIDVWNIDLFFPYPLPNFWLGEFLVFTGIPTTIECRGFIQAAEARGLEHQGSLGPARGEAFRDNERLAASNPTRFVHTCKRSLDLAKPKGPTTSTTFPAFSATHWKGVTKEMVGL
jgi:hypothetical protein